METTLQPLSLGEILDAAIRLYRRNFWLFVGIIALAEIPFLLVQVILPLVYTGDAIEEPFSVRWLVINGANLMVRWLFVDGFGAAALAYAVAQRYLRQETSMLSAYRRLGAVWHRVVGILLVFPIILLVVLLWSNIPCLGWLTGAGMLIFLSVGIMPFAPAAVMIENQSALGGLLRAWELARRRFFWVITFNIIMTILGWTLAVGPSLIVSALVTALIGSSFGLESQMETFYGLVSSVSGTLFNMLFLPIQIGAWTLTYYDLRVRSEAFDLALRTTDDAETANRLVRLPTLQKWLSLGDLAKFTLTSLLVVVLFVLAYVLPIMLVLFLAVLAG